LFLLLSAINASSTHSTSTYSELYTMLKINRRRTTHDDRTRFSYRNNRACRIRMFLVSQNSGRNSRNTTGTQQELVKHRVTKASSDHIGIIITWKPESKFVRKWDGSVLNVFVLHETNCVIRSDEAFCLILITTLTTTNSVMLHKQKKKRKKIINTQLTFTLHVGYLSTGQI